MHPARKLAGKRVLVTGNTGFKGAWLQLWLQLIGAEVSGMSLEPDAKASHWQTLAFDSPQYIVDVRDADKTGRVIRSLQPELIFHLAAQSLVRESYRQPLATWQTNVLGTANVLEACRRLDKQCAVIVVTSDKCYENRGSGLPFRESDPLGGHDPYSASKAATELVASSYQRSFSSTETGMLVATARAGNVVGGGDWSDDRLIPDAMRAIFSDRPLDIRYPTATRPWQHVLEAISGYLILAARLAAREQHVAKSWNFGPDGDAHRKVVDVLERLRLQFPSLSWQVDSQAQPHEAELLSLDSSLARHELGWQPRWDFDTTMERVAAWYETWNDSGQAITEAQINEYQRG